MPVLWAEAYVVRIQRNEVAKRKFIVGMESDFRVAAVLTSLHKYKEKTLHHALKKSDWTEHLYACRKNTPVLATTTTKRPLTKVI